jgi:hypothetical protein
MTQVHQVAIVTSLTVDEQSKGRNDNTLDVGIANIRKMEFDP